MKVALLLANLILVFSMLGCGSGPTSSEPPWDTEVKDTDVCQPVRKKKTGGDLILCGGKVCNLKTLTCGTLSSRKKGSTQDWVPISASEEAYDSSKEYRCTCHE
jgi:hypothetical protein